MKITNIIINALCLLPFIGIGQESSAPSFKRYSIGINISPDFCYRALYANKTDNTTGSIIEYRNSYEEPKLGFTAGFNFNYFLKNSLSLESGIYFSNKGFYMSMQNWLELCLPANEPFTFYKTYQTLEYIDIPIKLNYYLGKKKVQLVSTIGLTGNILIKESSISMKSDNYWGGIFLGKNENSFRGARPIALSAVAGIGAKFNLNDSFSLSVQPNFTYGIMSTYKDVPISEHLWSAGLNVGANYRF